MAFASQRSPFDNAKYRESTLMCQYGKVMQSTKMREELKGLETGVSAQEIQIPACVRTKLQILNKIK
jgi:hypothetical protein